MSRCAYCKKRIGLFQEFHEIEQDEIHDFCFTDYEYQRERRKFELRKYTLLKKQEKNETIK